MGVEAHRASAEMYGQLGVVVLFMRNEGYGIYKCNCLVIGGKTESFFDGDCCAVTSELPSLQLGQARHHLGGSQCSSCG